VGVVGQRPLRCAHDETVPEEEDAECHERERSAGRAEALNCFSYTGGFSVSAALGGVRHVVSVDVDRDAIALARDVFRANGLVPADHAFAARTRSSMLARYKREGRRFDLVVCDPPAFAKSQKAVRRRSPAMPP